MSKKSIILLVIFFCLIPALIPLIILSQNIHRNLIISKEFSITKYGGRYSIEGALENRNDSPIKIDELTISFNGKNSQPNTISELQYTLTDIVIDKNLIINEENLSVFNISGNGSIVSAQGSGTVKCVIDGKEYTLSRSSNGNLIPIVIISLTAITVLIFFFISLKKDRQEKNIPIESIYFLDFIYELKNTRNNKATNPNTFDESQPLPDECPSCFHKISPEDEECSYCGFHWSYHRAAEYNKKLLRLKNLLKNNIISKEEYERLKSQLRNELNAF